jgi:tetratricopeptide (TPR) repeat protein
LYTEYAKQKNYADAYEFWSQLYAQCPNYNKNIYIYGEKILQWQIQQAKNDQTKLSEWVDKLMKLYDDRITYFGNDAKKPAAAILGDKAIAYLTYKGSNADIEKAYSWLTECVNAQKENADAKVLVQWVNVSYKKYKQDANFKSNYIANYMTGSEYINGALDRYQIRLDADLEKGEDEAAKKDANIAQQFIDYIKTQKVGMVSQFGGSGAADCQTLVDLFTPQVEAQKDNIQFLTNVIALLSRSKCKDSNLYFTASEAVYNLSPSMESAKGMAQQAVKKENWDAALKYFEQSLGFAIQPEDKADILLLMATVQYKYKKNFSKARELCYNSLKFDSKQADPYIYIADMYRQSGAMVFPNEDAVVRSTVYMAAVEELQKAKAADPSRAADINSMIASYKKAYPEKSQLFMKGMTGGKKFTIPGWMNVTITLPD